MSCPSFPGYSAVLTRPCPSSPCIQLPGTLSRGLAPFHVARPPFACTLASWAPSAAVPCISAPVMCALASWAPSVAVPCVLLHLSACMVHPHIARGCTMLFMPMLACQHPHNIVMNHTFPDHSHSASQHPISTFESILIFQFDFELLPNL